MNHLEFESKRAAANLYEAVEYRKVLEWIRTVIGIVDNQTIVEEINKATGGKPYIKEAADLKKVDGN